MIRSSLRFVFIFVLFLSSCHQAPNITENVKTLSNSKLPGIQIGYTGQNFVVTLSFADQPTEVHTLTVDNKHEIHFLPELPGVVQILSTPSGVLLMYTDRFVSLSSDGKTFGPVISLRDFPSGIFYSFDWDGEKISAAVMGEGKIYYRQYDLKGKPLAPSTILAVGKWSSEVNLIPISGKNHLLVWSEMDDGGMSSILNSVVNQNGKVIRDTKIIYTPKKETVNCCWATPTQEGSALLVWMDNIFESWKWNIYSLNLGLDGPLGPVQQINQNGKKEDSMYPIPLADSQDQWVAWQSGLKWDFLFPILSGSGEISLSKIGNPNSLKIFRTPGSVQQFAAKIHDHTIGIAAISETKKGKFEYFEQVFPLP